MSDAQAPRRRRRRAVILGALGVFLLLAVATAWVGTRALAVKSELEALAPLSADVQSAIANRDLDALAVTASALDVRASRAAELTGDPVWRAFEFVPFIGPNLTAVRVTSSELKAISDDVVTPLVDMSRREGDGTGVVGIVSEAQRPLSAAASTLSTASVALDAIDTDQVLPPLAKGVLELRDAVDRAAPAVASLSKITGVLPDLLGENGPRSILLMLQNNAELRTGGGITGTFALLNVSDGAIQIVRQQDSSEFSWRTSPIIDIPESTASLYGDGVARFVQNTTMTPDFPLSAQLATTWWADQAAGAGITQAKPDVVLSIDPEVLRSLLAVAGPVALSDGSELTAENITQRLLVDPYMTLDSAGQTDFFQQVTTAAMSQLVSVLGDPLKMMSTFAGPVAEGRISLWSADPAEQSAIESTPLAGPAARQAAAGPDAYAVYFNDATGGKMDTFMGTKIAIGSAQCRTDGRSEVRVSVTLNSTAPADGGDVLPASMTGGGKWGTGTGDIGMNVSVSAPTGTYFGGVTLDGVPRLSTNVTDGDFPVSAVRINLQPGEVNVLEFTFIAAEPGVLHPTILHTPMVVNPVVEDSTLSCG